MKVNEHVTVHIEINELKKMIIDSLKEKYNVKSIAFPVRSLGPYEHNFELSEVICEVTRKEETNEA
jgi:hypothetical protein